MNDEYFIEQARRVRSMADKADPFTKKRLLALAETYDARLGRPSRASRQLPLVAINASSTPVTTTPAGIRLPRPAGSADVTDLPAVSE